MTTVDGCSDPSLGKLLPEYELGLLDDAEKDAFERHLMSCENCAGQAETMRQPMKLIRTQDSLRRQLNPSETEARFEPSVLKRIAGYLWPSGSFWGKPAVSLALLCLMVAFSINEMTLRTDSDFAQPAAILALSDSRAAGANKIVVSGSEDLVISFGFLSANPNQLYQISVIDPGNYTVYLSDDFQFDKQLSGYLVLDRSRLRNGVYTLIINNPADSSPLGADTIRFEVSINE